MEFFLIGFFPKFRATPENWKLHSDSSHGLPGGSSVSQLCSVSNCIVKGLDGFQYPQLTNDSFNQYGGFNHLYAALSAIELQKTKAQYDVFAYALSEHIYEDGQLQVDEMGCVEPEDIVVDTSFEMLGYDVVEKRDCSFFCSPLYCNGQAGLNADLLNEFGLIKSEAGAVKLATEFSISKPEPGPYSIVEVWRYRPLH